MMETCINLKNRFGGRYRVVYEESFRADRGVRTRLEDPWLMIVPCRYGHIFPHDGSLLAASVDGHPNVAGVLRRLRCCRFHQDGDFGELTVLFNLVDFDKVAAIMRPRCRRQVSESEHERLRLIGLKNRFQAGVDVEHTPRPCVGIGLGDSQAIQEQTDAKSAPVSDFTAGGNLGSLVAGEVVVP